MTSPDAVEILLVEDNPHDLELALRALTKANLGSNVLVVEDGAEALDFVFCSGAYANRPIERKPRLILLDLKLPKVDGLEVLRRIKSDTRTNTIPVVVLTSSREESDVIESYALGVNSYVVKPVHFDQFITCVSEVGHYWIGCNEPPR